MSVLPFDLPDKAIQPTNQFIFLTGTEDFTTRKTAAAKIFISYFHQFFLTKSAKYAFPPSRHPANNNHSSISVITKYHWTKTQFRMIIIQ
ncbi:hypothetical protein [Klebsiella pneumoniae]|uniref:hypothetical protein n=1 Tax=Klebsiella pneumoniae TaxID=573 RepID=UPI002F96D3C3